MPHTKRSPEFTLRINALISKLAANTLDSQERSDIAHILHYNTTDSPCIVKAAADEPIFTLRAHDKTADRAVDFWCDFLSIQFEPLMDANTSWRSVPLSLSPQSPKIINARECADEMRAYRNRKMPD